MFRLGSVFLASLYSSLLWICRLIYIYFFRSKACVVEENGSNFSENRSQGDDEVVSKNSTGFLSGGLNGKESLVLQKSRKDSVAETEDSVSLQSGLISNTSKCQFMCGENVSGFMEEPKTMKFVVQEMFVESDDVLGRNDHCLGCEISQIEDSLDQEKLIEFHEEESGPPSFYFKLLNDFCSIDEDTQKHIPEREEDDSFSPLRSIKLYDEKEKPQLFESDRSSVEGIDHAKDEIQEEEEEQEFSYEVELIPISHSSRFVADQESDAAGNEIMISTQKINGNSSENWMSNFLDETDQGKQDDLEELRDVDHDLSEKADNFDDEYIVLENISLKELTHIDEESTSCECDSKDDELLQGQRKCWNSESDDDEDEADVLSEHQNLVQQMKMELKNCRVRGLPTISEECESPKMVEDLKPMEIYQKIEYKDVMEEIRKFHKCYSEKMRKLDILNYQTLHAISFLQLKDSEVFTMKKADTVPLVSPKIWPRKVQRIYADPMHKSISEMHCDLELVYVGQLCLSWEILCWLSVKARELLERESAGNHSYTRAAEEFQQFQVLMQRFMEDEPFQGRRNPNYVKSRCMIRTLLQVPTIKDDCLKTKKERREETDTVSLDMLVEIIRESMLIFRDFLFADKESAKVVLKGIQGTKADLQNLGNSESLSDIISILQKKERRIKDQIRSRNCIVKKLKKQQGRQLEREILTSQLELRLVSRVLYMSRLTKDQLVWCKKKLDSISFVGRKVNKEPSFLLFPC